MAGSKCSTPGHTHSNLNTKSCSYLLYQSPTQYHQQIVEHQFPKYSHVYISAPFPLLSITILNNHGDKRRPSLSSTWNNCPSHLLTLTNALLFLNNALITFNNFPFIPIPSKTSFLSIYLFKLKQDKSFDNLVATCISLSRHWIISLATPRHYYLLF